MEGKEDSLFKEEFEIRAIEFHKLTLHLLVLKDFQGISPMFGSGITTQDRLKVGILGKNQMRILQYPLLMIHIPIKDFVIYLYFISEAIMYEG